MRCIWSHSFSCAIGSCCSRIGRSRFGHEQRHHFGQRAGDAVRPVVGLDAHEILLQRKCVRDRSARRPRNRRARGIPDRCRSAAPGVPPRTGPSVCIVPRRRRTRTAVIRMAALLPGHCSCSGTMIRGDWAACQGVADPDGMRRAVTSPSGRGRAASAVRVRAVQQIRWLACAARPSPASLRSATSPAKSGRGDVNPRRLGKSGCVR